MKKLAVVMPAFNERPVIAQVIKKIPKQLGDFKSVKIIVVDDASDDGTAKAAETAGAIVIRHRFNLGNGGATITGLMAARQLGVEVAVTMDADGQHNPQDMVKLVAKLDEGYDMVIGSRMKGHRGAMPVYKVIGNQLLNVLTLIFARRWVSDSQSGFRALSKKAVAKIQLGLTGFDVWSEMIWEARVHGLKVAEVPIEIIYTSYSRKKGQHYLNAINIFLGLLMKPRRR